MYLKQTAKDTILFGTDERRHKLTLTGLNRFKAADVDAAADDLLAAYPDEVEQIVRYADRLKAMLANQAA